MLKVGDVGGDGSIDKGRIFGAIESSKENSSVAKAVSAIPNTAK